MNRRRVRIGLGILAVVVALGWIYSRYPVGAPAIDFADDLTGPTSAQLDIPFGHYMFTPEGLLRVRSVTGHSNGSERPLVRSRSALYLHRDFIFEAEVIIPADTQDMVFVGVGDGAPASPNNEPSGGFGFRIHRLPDNHDIRWSATELQAGSTFGRYAFDDTIGTVPPDGVVRVRIERSGDRVTGSVLGQPESERTVMASAYPELLRSGHGFLFFANSATGTIFKHVSVRPRT